MIPLRTGDPRRLGEYRLQGRLGAGGMGVVYFGLAPDRRRVAVKVIGEWIAHDPEFRARFRREAAAARRVAGPFTAALLDGDPDGEPPWLATEYLPGLSLREAVGDAGGLPTRSVRALALGLAEALVSIHGAGVVHRDLTPRNVMLTDDGPRIIDFGIARPEGADAITAAGAAIGTRRYMSPEHLAGRRVGPPGDVFALGAVLAYAATGRAPFTTRYAPDGIDLRGVGDRRLSSLIGACLRWEPGDRPSAATVLDRLSGSPVSLQGTGWLPDEVAERIRLRSAGTATPDDDTAGPSVMEADTLDPPETGAGPEDGNGPRRGHRRRVLLAGTGAAVLAAGAAWVLREPPRPVFVPAAVPRTRPASAPRRLPEPSVSWETKVGDAYPSLTVVGDTVVAFEDDKVHGLDLGTGARRWHRDAILPLLGAGAYVLDRVGNLGFGLTALDAASGGVRWSDDTMTPNFAIGSGGSVYTGNGEQTRALSAADGRMRWETDVPVDHGLSGGDGIVIVHGAGELVVLDADTGDRRWQLPDVADWAPAQPVADGLVYVGGATLRALDARDGAVVWEAVLGAAASVVLGDGTVFVTEYSGVAHAWDARTGRLRWSRTVSDGTSVRYGYFDRLAYAHGTLVVTSAGKAVHGLDGATGARLWTYSHPVAPFATVAADGRVLVGARGGLVRALEPPGRW